MGSSRKDPATTLEKLPYELIDRIIDFLPATKEKSTAFSGIRNVRRDLLGLRRVSRYLQNATQVAFLNTYFSTSRFLEPIYVGAPMAELLLNLSELPHLAAAVKGLSFDTSMPRSHVPEAFWINHVSGKTGDERSTALQKYNVFEKVIKTHCEDDTSTCLTAAVSNFTRLEWVAVSFDIRRLEEWSLSPNLYSLFTALRKSSNRSRFGLRICHKGVNYCQPTVRQDDWSPDSRIADQLDPLMCETFKKLHGLAFVTSTCPPDLQEFPFAAWLKHATKLRYLNVRLLGRYGNLSTNTLKVILDIRELNSLRTYRLRGAVEESATTITEFCRRNKATLKDVTLEHLRFKFGEMHQVL